MAEKHAISKGQTISSVRAGTESMMNIRYIILMNMYYLYLLMNQKTKTVFCQKMIYFIFLHFVDFIQF